MLRTVEESKRVNILIPCGCGQCNLQIYKFDEHNGWKERQYARGHQFKALVRTKEHGQKISKAKMGHETSKETREKISKTLTGTILSEETRRKIGLANIGDKNNWWKGGKYLDSDGYYKIWSPNHPFKDGRGYVFEHRLVYERYYNCCLLPWILIHHINEIKTDNRIENLDPMTREEHSRYHFKNKKIGLFLNVLEIMGFED